MNRRRRAIGTGIGAAIGAVLGAVVFDFLLAFEPGGIHVDAAAGLPFVMIGTAAGTIIGAVLTNRRGEAQESGAGRRSFRRFFLAMAITVVLVVAFSLATTIMQEFFSLP